MILDIKNNFIAIRLDVKETGDQKGITYIFDDTFQYSYEYNTTVQIEKRKHGCSVCPCSFFMPTESPLEKAIGKMTYYNQLITGYEMHRIEGGFPDKYKVPNDQAVFDDHNRGNLLTSQTQKENFEGTKGDSTLGSETNISDKQLKDNDQKLSDIGNFSHTENPDVSLLQHYDEDERNRAENIKVLVIGINYHSENNQAVNADQIRNGQTTQQYKLEKYGEAQSVVIRRFLLCELEKAGIKQPLEFKLGNKYFLKTSMELLNEMEAYLKIPDSRLLLDNKMKELIETETRSEEAVRQYEFMKLIDPFSGYSQQFVEGQPEATDFYRILAQFEFLNGKVSEYGMANGDARSRISSIINTLEDVKQITNATTGEGGEGEG